MNKKWTLEEDKELQDELNAKLSYDKISLNHKRSIENIKMRIIETIIYPIIYNEDNESKEEIIKDLSVKYDIETYLIENFDVNSNVGKKWTLEEDKELQEELKANLSYDKISLNHKRTILGIKSRIIGTIIYPMINDENKEEIIKESSIKYNIDENIIRKYINKIDIKKDNNKDDNKDNKKDNNKDIYNILTEINNKLDLLLKIKP